VPRVILFREEHSPRVFVPKVDFVSAAATTPEVRRRGGPYALLTNMALFDFDRARGGFALRSVHPPFAPSDIRSHTGFDYVEPTEIPATPLPNAEALSLLRGRIMDELAETYPVFARSMLQAA
jgi:glutaconate CoA-transferase, subunit B